MSDMTVSQMVAKIAKLKGIKQDEAREYMIRVAFGRLNALLTYNKAAKKAKPAKKAKAKKAAKKAAITRAYARKHGVKGSDVKAARKVLAVVPAATEVAS